MNTSVFFYVGLGCALIAGCSDSTNHALPTLPSSVNATSTVITSVPLAVATVSGTVQNATPSAALAGTHPIDAAPLRVMVAGTSLSTVVSTSGQFTLQGVPAGLADLWFQGPGVDAPLRLGILQPGQRVDVVVTVVGSTARVVDLKNGRDNDDERNRTVKVDGTLTRLNGRCPVVSFVVGTIAIKTTSVTNIDRGCSALENGVIIEVKGTRQGDGSILARRIEREDDDDNEDDDDRGSSGPQR